uniref:Putative ovule protein n=1 Tax=Solanum chacoense TaxID=4108 RepID=A0A0V0HDG8_SOLCH
MAEEAHNGGVAEKEATQVAVVFTAVKPQLFVKAPKAKDAVQFYKNAFGAEEVGRVNNPKRKAEQETPLILSVELKIGSFFFIVSDLIEEDSTAPVKTATTGSVFCLETEKIISAEAKAITAGAIAEIRAEDGDADGARMGSKLIDPYGNVWLICTPVKESE